MTSPSRPGLVRALGRWDLTALTLNASVGGAIFGIPTIIARLLGGASPLAFLAAGAAMAVIGLCLAEVASRFRDAGGPYLYARLAFGRFVALQVGWAYWLVRITAAAAVANVFVVYLAELWPGATDPITRVIVLTAIIGFLTSINVTGVQYGARMSDVLALAKLTPLAIFCVVGLYSVRFGDVRMSAAAGMTEWSEAILLLVFTYGGFEAAVIPAAEFKNPTRDVPYALCVALGLAVLLHFIVQVVVVGTVPLEAMTDRPLAAAATTFLGSHGGQFMATAALLSIYGALSGSMLNTPRLTYALAEQGDFPRFFAAVHSRFRTPYVSIVLYGALTWMLAVWGSFRWNAMLSAAARLLVYASTCLSLLVFRRRGGNPPEFRLVAAPAFAVVGVGFCVWLALSMSLPEFAVLGLTALLAAVTWLFPPDSRMRT